MMIDWTIFSKLQHILENWIHYLWPTRALLVHCDKIVAHFSLRTSYLSTFLFIFLFSFFSEKLKWPIRKQTKAKLKLVELDAQLDPSTRNAAEKAKKKCHSWSPKNDCHRVDRSSGATRRTCYCRRKKEADNDDPSWKSIINPAKL